MEIARGGAFRTYQRLRSIDTPPLEESNPLPTQRDREEAAPSTRGASRSRRRSLVALPVMVITGLHRTDPARRRLRSGLVDVRFDTEVTDLLTVAASRTTRSLCGCDHESTGAQKPSRARP